MRVVALAAVLALVAAATAVGAPAPYPPGPHLREWLALLGHPRPTAAIATMENLRQAAVQTHATVRLDRVYKLSSPYGSQATAQAVEVRTDQPARYLLGMGGLLAAAGRPAYIRVIDPRGQTVFEWYSARRQNMLYVRPGLEGCSPAIALGWSKIPRCPAR